MERSRAVPMERLLAERGWVRALARTLARGGDADDLEQRVWLDALRRPPREDANLRGWFATVLRRRARDARREGVRRAARERDAGATPRGEPVSPPAIAEAREARRLVVEALLDLRVEQREALILRYFHGLSPPGIAARLGCPLETVRTRLRRGLEALRERLRAGGPEGSGLAPAAAGPGAVPPGTREGMPDAVSMGGPRVATGGAVALTGGVVMATSAKSAVLAGAAVAVLLGWWLLRGGDPDASGERGAAPWVRRAGEPLPSPVGEAPVGESAETWRPLPMPPAPALSPAQVPGPAEVVDGAPRPVPLDRLPLAVAAETPVDGHRRLEVEVDPLGRIHLGGRSVDLARLREALRQRADESRAEDGTGVSTLDVVLRVDRDLSWRAAQWLMQECAAPAVRVRRIHFAVATAGGSGEGAVPTFLPVDEAAGPAPTAAPPPEEEGSTDRTAAAAGAPRPEDLPVMVPILLSRTRPGPEIAPRDVPAAVRARVEELAAAGRAPGEGLPEPVREATRFVCHVSADPGTPAGDVVAVVVHLREAGFPDIHFRGTSPLRAPSLEEAVSRELPASGPLVAVVLGEALAPRR